MLRAASPPPRIGFCKAWKICGLRYVQRCWKEKREHFHFVLILLDFTFLYAPLLLFSYTTHTRLFLYNTKAYCVDSLRRAC